MASAFFTTGNVVAKVGAILLFFGVGFLMKYAADRAYFPIEVRVAAVAMLGIALLAGGVLLRRRQEAYGTLLQGVAFGLLFLNVFVAANLYQMLPLVLGFAIMLGLVLIAGVLAVAQDSRVLATLGSVGGFLAPVLTASSDGSHLQLFTYYALLNLGVLGIAWFKAWRELNLVGFLFTFVMGAAWGIFAYRPEVYLSTQFFLGLFFVLYVAVAILYALRQPLRLRGYVDASLVFGVPLAAFALQAALVSQFAHGVGTSAAVVAAFYFLLAAVLWRRWPTELGLLFKCFTALAIGFASVAVPLALDGRSTAAVWALQGAALVWLGLRQREVLSRIAGLLLQVAAATAFLLSIEQHVADRAVFNAFFLGALMVSLGGLLSSALLRNRPKAHWEAAACAVALAWGLIWWFGASLFELHRLLSVQQGLNASLLLFAGSAWLMSAVARRLSWPQLGVASLGLLPVLGFMALVQWLLPAVVHPFAGWGVLAWGAAFAVQYRLLYLGQLGALHAGLPVWHQLTLTLAAVLSAWSLAWVASSWWPSGGEAAWLAWGLCLVFWSPAYC
ncbi:DUF2339 domain-containing protein [Alkalilimnicola ehrlichii]|uniref:DUF2339 domain-containing protein n=1 Tax=Alkalilimnicola ehrlichii TaxID=351052 RepID=UPI0015F2658B|nr:DUF2339 domain-containing protein [Alkalilimnicola ehrlichii]